MYHADPPHVIQWADVEVADDVSYEERPVRIVDSREQVLRGKTIRLVRVMWQNHGEESTWEREDEVRVKYPRLFDTWGTF